MRPAKRTGRSADEPGTQAVQRALLVLGCCRPERPRPSLTEIAEDANLTMPTAHRIVKALQTRGYLVQDPATKLYSLGPTVMRLAQVILQRNNQHELIRLVLPHLERLRDRTGESAALLCPVGLQSVCVAQVPSRHAVRMDNTVGNREPLHTGAAGKVILAWSSTATVERVLAELVRDGEARADRSRLERELPRIRKKGYALSLGEVAPDSAAIAVPVFFGSGLIAGAISIAGPIDRWTRDLMLDEAPMTTAIGHGISASLGYAGASEQLLA